MKRLLLLVPALLAATAAQAQTFPRMELAAGIHKVDAEVAATQETRMQGLMFRTLLGDGKGMLFVFPVAGQHCMWMRNTLIPLSVAFLDDKGKILNIEDMQPQTEDNHCAAAPARYALEMDLGWFRRKGIAPGTALSGLQRAPAPR